MTWANPEFGATEIAQKWAAIKKLSWQIPIDHPRQNRSHCVSLSLEASRRSAPQFYRTLRHETIEHFLYVAKDALVEERGLLMIECGYIQPHDNCETMFKIIGRKWTKGCRARLRRHQHLMWRDMFRNASRHGRMCLRPKMAVFQGAEEEMANVTESLPTAHPTARPTRAPMPLTTLSEQIPLLDRVFVVSSTWDHNYAHFIYDSLSPLVRHLDWLKANPDVFIHIRKFEDRLGNETSSAVVTGRNARKRVLALLGLEEGRFVTGPVRARLAISPRTSTCNYLLSSALELRLLSHRLTALAHGHLGDAQWRPLDLFRPGGPLYRPRGNRPRVVLQHRHKSSFWAGWRNMNNETFALVLASVEAHLRPSSVVVFSSGNDTQQQVDHYRNEIITYNEADILIGMHGAGLANLIFMRPGSIVVELTSDYEGKVAPVCGYTGPLAAVFGLHHVIHYFEIEPPPTVNNSSHESVANATDDSIYDHVPIENLTRIFDGVGRAAARAWHTAAAHRNFL